MSWSRWCRAVCAGLLLAGCGEQVEVSTPITAEQLALRDRGLAELENERPEQAELIFRQLLAQRPGERMPRSNLVISLLRQQQTEQAAETLQPLLVAGATAHSLGLQALIEQQRGNPEAALQSLQTALQAAPRDSELAFAAYQLASQSRDAAAAAVAGMALQSLLALRPDNPWVLLRQLQSALAAGDRAAAAGSAIRLRELLSWQLAEPEAGQLQRVQQAIDQAQLAQAAAELLRLENLLRGTDLYRESLRELRTGIVGVPLERFDTAADQHEPGGEPVVPIHFQPQSLGPSTGETLALRSADLDGDGANDLLRLSRTADAGMLQWYLAAAGHALSGERQLPRQLAADARISLLDLDNDADLDLLLWGSHGVLGLEARDDGLAVRDDAWGLPDRPVRSLAALDFDMEGDLDLFIVDDQARPVLYRNAQPGLWQALPDEALTGLPAGLSGVRDIVASDLDRDGDIDLLLLDAVGLGVAENLRHGHFAYRPLPDSGLADAVAVADLDDDGWPDIVLADAHSVRWRQGLPTAFAAPQSLTTHALGAAMQLWLADFDNDGRKDVLLQAREGLALWQQQAADAWHSVAADWPAAARVDYADLNADGQLDLAVAGATELLRLSGAGAGGSGWLSLRLRGLTTGNGKNNAFGFGALVEVRQGQRRQFHEVWRDPTHIGLGVTGRAEVLRVLWTNGVPQNRIDVSGNRHLVEEQQLKGSCPFLYAWDGERFAFVTDLLWNAPLGLPVAPGVWLPADPSELVRIDGLQPLQGRFELRITEELWEAAFFDQLRLWVVDHPEALEVASNLRVVPGQGPQPERVLGARELRPLAAAIDGQGREVGALVAERDEVYADGYVPTPYQGVAKPWSFTMDLGQAPASAVRLWLEGWIFPADASLNLALAQRRDLPHVPPRIEVETATGWQLLLADAGFPAGKTKATVIDLPALPAGSRRLRIVSSLWLHWDRIRWSIQPDDATAEVIARLSPTVASLRERGYSRLQRVASNAPHAYDYNRVSKHSPWEVFPGNYTRLGDVLPLLQEADDFSVILAAGDELALSFDAGSLPAPRPGWRRTLFLESHGWDKDADRNTWQAQQLEPLPFRAMSGYPGEPGEQFPDTPAHREYQAQWLTRRLP